MQRRTYAGGLVSLDDAAPPEPPASPVLSPSGGGLLPESRPLVYGDPTCTLVYPNRICKQYHTCRKFMIQRTERQYTGPILVVHMLVLTSNTLLGYADEGGVPVTQ